MQVQASSFCPGLMSSYLKSKGGSLSTHHCKNCSASFEISAEEAAFFERMSFVAGGEQITISLPTYCPLCRLQRRMAHRNQIYVLLGKVRGQADPRFSMYFEGAPFPVVTNEDWWGQVGWSPEEHGREFDFSRLFFEQFAELRAQVPRAAVNAALSDNSSYCNNVASLKNCYFVFDANTIEDSFYLETAVAVRDSVDCSSVDNCELCYDCAGCRRCYSLQSSDHCLDCTESFFLLNCRSCRNCFGCANLIQSQYCIFNKQHTKEQYEAFVAAQALGSWSGREKVRQRVDAFRATFPRPHLYGSRCEMVSGNHIHSARQVEDSFMIREGERLRYCFACSQQVNDCQDLTIWGQKAELIYEGIVCGNNVFHLLFCFNCWNGSSDLTYCDTCHGSSHLFGCVSMVKRQHCILNRQYSEEEYQALLPRIVRHMRKTGEWGEFFPASLALVPYNYSLAQRYFPLSKEEVLQRGLWWHEPRGAEARISAGAIAAAALPDVLPQGDVAIVALSAVSGKPFRITTEEIRRYRKLNVPLPRLTYDERMNARMARVGGVRLHERSCDKTGRLLRSIHPPEAGYPVWDREEFEREMV